MNPTNAMSLRKYPEKKFASTTMVNRLTDSVQDLITPSLGGTSPRDRQPEYPYFGVVTALGPLEEIDYTDARYWVKLGYFRPHIPVGDVIIFDPVDSEAVTELGNTIVQVTNLPELRANSHVLPTDDRMIVRFGGFVDGSDPPKIHYIMEVGQGSVMMFARLTSGTLIDVANPNRWRYTWEEQVLERNGLYIPKPGGQTSTETGEFSYNTIEAFNTATGMQGNSVNLDDIPTGYVVQPASAGTPVVIMWLQVNCDGVNEWMFSFENAVTGTCSPP